MGPVATIADSVDKAEPSEDGVCEGTAKEGAEKHSKLVPTKLREDKRPVEGKSQPERNLHQLYSAR